MKKAKILVVEDEAITAKILVDTLKLIGYDVVATVSSGDDAIEKIKGSQPDLVLMDILIEGKMDGVEAAALIRERFDLPVIFTTSFSSEELIERVKITEPFGYLVKPFKESDLRSTIEISIYKHKTDKEMQEKLETIERMNKLMVGRELEMEKLRRKIKELEAQDAGLKK